MLELVREVGAAAGSAAVAGLAALSALHFSHARDVRRLREWASRAPEYPGQGVTGVPGRAATRIALVGVLVLAGVAAYGVTHSTGDGSAKRSKRHTVAVKPGTVTVAVLNGTMVAGLAARLRDQLAAAGFNKGTINDFSDKQLAESVVEYAPGHRAEAKAVGRSVGVTRREPVTADSRALAGGVAVIVIAGADKAAAEPAGGSRGPSG